MTRSETIDSKALKGLVEAKALRGATILGQPGGWSIVVRYGSVERVVSAQRAHRARLWRNLNTAASYVHHELGLHQFEVNSRDHDLAAMERNRPDTAERQRRAHEAVEYDAWFRAEAQDGIDEADDPDAVWIPHQTVMASLDARIARLKKLVEDETK